MKIVKTYNRIFPSSINNLGIAVKDVLSNLKTSFGPLMDCTIFELTVVLNEIVLNAIKHGNKEDETKNVKITSGITENGFVCFIVEDEGCGYDYDFTCRNKFANMEVNDVYDVMESGRGIFIVRNLCDRVKVNNKGNKIVVLKRLL